MHTSEFNTADRPYSAATTFHLPEASNDTVDLVKAAQRAAKAIWRDGFRYSKAGIVMDDLIPAGTGPRPLFDRRDREQSERLMRGRLREGAESYAKALASDILR